MTSSEVPTVPLNEVPGEFDDSVRAAAEKAGAILLDVREPDEWALGHAPGAVHIPVDDIPARLDELDYDAQLYVICSTGRPVLRGGQVPDPRRIRRRVRRRRHGGVAAHGPPAGRRGRARAQDLLTKERGATA